MDDMLIIFNVINTFVIFDYMRITYGFKYNNFYVNMGMVVTFYTIHTFVNLYHLVVLNIIMEFFMINIFSYIFFKPRTEKFYFNSFFQIYLILLDFIVTGVSAMLNDMTFTEMQVSNLYIPWSTINFIALITTYKSVIQIFENNYAYISLKAGRRNLLTGIVCEYIAILYLSMYYNHTKGGVLGTTQIFLIALINIWVVLTLVAKQSKIEKCEIKKLYGEHANGMKNAFKHRQIINNKIIDIYLEHSKKYTETMKKSQEELNAHIKEMKAKFQNIDIAYDTEDCIINVIINRAKTKAKEKGICLKDDIELVNWSFINDTDLTTIVMGLIVNAIDTISNEKKMEIVVKRAGNFIVVKVIHTCDKNKINRSTRMILPSGCDIEVVLRAEMAIESARLYGGQINFEVVEDKFIARVRLPVKEI